MTHKREMRVISEEGERKIGQETHKKLIEDFGELKDPVWQEYVDSLGKKIAAVSDRPRLQYEFAILDTDMVNAFAAPGGFIFVTRRLLEEMTSEAELAVVLGHEIGHVAAWHSVNMIEKQMGYGTLATLGAIFTGVHAGPEAMIMLAQTADLFTTMYLMGYSREYELEADRVGLRYAISAGYDPEAALRFFQRLAEFEKQEGLDEWESFFRSHPPTKDRIRLAKQFIARMKRPGRSFSEGWDFYQEMKTRLPTLAQEDKGSFDGLVFHHDKWGVKLEIPSGWKWEPGARQALATFRESAGSGWGELRHFKVPPQMSHQAFAKKVVKSKKWKGVSQKEVLYPVGYGTLGKYYGSGVLGGIYLYRVFFLVREERGYALLCASPPDQMTRYLVPCEQILRGFEVR